ncbi:hypothetical protein Bbelb_185220 [Branchiostoma belcheri]|nr:hypothetical protein Bbelb_185220 [Branchiostoma belcheri]
MIDVSPDFKRDNCRLGGSERSLRTPVAKAFGSRGARGPGTFHRPGLRARSPLAGTGGAAPRNYRGAPLFEPPDAKFRRGFPVLPSILYVKALLSSNPGLNLRHAARDTLLFYTEHRCWHIRLCPVRAKLPAPANDSGFRTVETISVHGEGFTLHDDKHNSYSRIQSKSGTKYQVKFAMPTLKYRLQQEFTGQHETQ